MTGNTVITPRPSHAALALARSLLTITTGRRVVAALPRGGSKSVKRISPRSFEEPVRGGGFPGRCIRVLELGVVGGRSTGVAQQSDGVLMVGCASLRTVSCVIRATSPTACVPSGRLRSDLRCWPGARHSPSTAVASAITPRSWSTSGQPRAEGRPRRDDLRERAVHADRPRTGRPLGRSWAKTRSSLWRVTHLAARVAEPQPGSSSVARLAQWATANYVTVGRARPHRSAGHQSPRGCSILTFSTLRSEGRCQIRAALSRGSGRRRLVTL